MSDTSNEFVLDDNDGANQSGGTLRQKLEQAVALLNQLKTENEQLKSEKTQRTVNETWDTLSVPAPIREFYKGDQTPDAMKQWWEASKGFFNIQATEEQGQAEELSPEQQANQDAARRYQEATSLGTDAITGGFDAVTAKVQQAKGLRGAELAAAKAEIYKHLDVPEY